jgi:hypothetical protein
MDSWSVAWVLKEASGAEQAAVGTKKDSKAGLFAKMALQSRQSWAKS